MKRPSGLCLVFHVVLFAFSLALTAAVVARDYDPRPPFAFSLSSSGTINTAGSGNQKTVHEPLNPYAIFINYELGMHCVGFDISYCCIIPPYNSIQAQAVRTGASGATPRLLSPSDGVRLRYSLRDNSYAKGTK